MKFNDVVKELKEDYGKNRHKLDVEKSSDYPKKVIGYDTGVTDRGKTGFPSDIHVLTQKEITGVKSKKKSRKWKKIKNKNNGSQKISEV